MPKIYVDTLNKEKLTVEAYHYDVNQEGGTLTIHFVKEDGQFEPSHCTWAEYRFVEGTKINIEVAENGWVVKTKDTIKVFSDKYAINEYVIEQSKEEIGRRADFDLEDWKDCEIELETIVEELENE